MNTRERTKMLEAPNALFHYTNQVSLYNIIDSASLHLTHFRYLNDPLEYSLATEMLINNSKPICKALEKLNIDYAMVFKILVDDKHIDEILQYIEDAYVFSFTSKNDKSMFWNQSYASNSGVCLSFPVHELNAKLMRAQNRLFKIRYVKHSDCIEDDIIDLYVIAIREVIDRSKHSIESIRLLTKNDCCKLLAQISSQLTYFIKSDVWEEEDEWRIVLFPLLNELEKDYVSAPFGYIIPRMRISKKYKILRKRIVPYFSLDRYLITTSFDKILLRHGASVSSIDAIREYHQMKLERQVEVSLAKTQIQ